MRILPIINELNASKVILKDASPAYSMNPQTELPSSSYPSAYVYPLTDISPYNDEICSSQKITQDVGIIIVAFNLTETNEPLADVREEIRNILTTFKTPVYDNNNIMRISGNVIDLNNSVISWLDVYRVELNYTPA